MLKWSRRTSATNRLFLHVSVKPCTKSLGYQYNVFWPSLRTRKCSHILLVPGGAKELNTNKEAEIGDVTGKSTAVPFNCGLPCAYDSTTG